MIYQILRKDMNKITLLQPNQQRQTLVEGRTYGLGFGFAKKIDDTHYQLMQPISTCKDYLNDFIFYHKYNSDISCYGLNVIYSDDSLFFGEENYLFIQVLASNNSFDKYKHLSKEEQLLNENYEYLEKTIQDFEEYFGIESKTKITKIRNNLYMLSFGKEWIESPYTLSFYTLMIRVFAKLNRSKYSIEEFVKIVLSDDRSKDFYVDTLSLDISLFQFWIYFVNKYKKNTYKELTKYGYPHSQLMLYHNQGFYSKLHTSIKNIHFNSYSNPVKDTKTINI